MTHHKTHHRASSGRVSSRTAAPRRVSRRQLNRSLLAGLGLGAASGSVGSAMWLARDPSSQVPHSQPGSELWVSAEGASEGHHLSWVAAGGTSEPQSIAVDFRGHGMAVDPQHPQRGVMFSRSPGTQGIVVNWQTGAPVARFDSPAGHHMHGHGCFSADGQWLFNTESDYRTGEGKIIVRNTDNWRVETLYSSGGVGPHEMHLMPDEQTLVVANGGLRTHPDSGRDILNLGNMDSSLTYVNAMTGEVKEQRRVDEPKASIRHFDVAPDGTVAFATQVQRAAMSDNRLVTLAGVHQPGQPVRMLPGPDTLMSQFRDYMGSVRISALTGIAGFTSPRGNLVGFWDIHRGELVGYHAFFDVCGLTMSADQQRFVLSNSAGEIRQLNARTLQEDKRHRQRFSDFSWDNHLLTVTLPG